MGSCIGKGEEEEENERKEEQEEENERKEDEEEEKDYKDDNKEGDEDGIQVQRVCKLRSFTRFLNYLFKLYINFLKAKELSKLVQTSTHEFSCKATAQHFYGGFELKK